MPLYGWFFLASYISGYVWTFRRIAGQMAWHFVSQDRKIYPNIYGNKQRPDPTQWFGSILSSLVFSLVWPLSLLIAYGIGNSSGIFFYIPPAEKEKRYKERIRQLEKECGL